MIWWSKRAPFPRWTARIWRRSVTTPAIFDYRGEAVAERSCDKHVVAYDFGMKRNILRMLHNEGCRVTVVPAKTSAEDVLALKPDGIFLSNGPGDPEPVTYAQNAIRNLMGRKPIFGICLGHQLIGLALGGKTYKLKFGHHGGNHPVKCMDSGKIEITAHNHNFAVDPAYAQGERSRVHARRSQRRHARRPAPSHHAALQRAISSRSRPGPARFALPLQGFHLHDGGVEGVRALAIAMTLACAQAAFAATPCAIPPNTNPRFFSDGSGHWREYDSKKQFPPADSDSEEDIESFGNAVIEYHFGNQDWSSQTISCYDDCRQSAGGELRGAHRMGLGISRAARHGAGHPDRSGEELLQHQGG